MIKKTKNSARQSVGLKTKTKISKLLVICLAVIILSAIGAWGIKTIIAAWTEPTALPPGGMPAGPVLLQTPTPETPYGTPQTGNINVSGSIIGGSITGNPLCIGSACRTTWPSYTAGTGINILGTVISNTGDLSNTNEIQNVITNKGLQRDASNNFGIINCSIGQIIKYDSSGRWVCAIDETGAGGGGNITGTGTINYLPKWTSTSILGNSQIFDNGTNVGIGDSTPDSILDILSSTGANTQLTITNTNASDYDIQIGFQVVEGTNLFTIGVDDSDGDKFKISTTALGTNDRLIISADGTVGVNENLTVSGNTFLGNGDDFVSIQGNVYLNGIIQTNGFKMLTGAGANKVLTSDVNGSGTWQTITSGGGENIWTRNPTYLTAGSLGQVYLSNYEDTICLGSQPICDPVGYKIAVFGGRNILSVINRSSSAIAAVEGIVEGGSNFQKGIYGSSEAGIGGYFRSRNESALVAEQTTTLGMNNIYPTAKIWRNLNLSGRDATAPVLLVEDNTVSTGHLQEWKKQGITKAIIDRNGNFGIGTANPVYNLDVIGNIRATGNVYYGGTAGATTTTKYNQPDYVFNDGYKVMKTEEVEKFLKEQGHLPWMTSIEKEKEENGMAIDMTRMSFETVETVENLQLQIIEQQKRIAYLEKIITEIKANLR